MTGWSPGLARGGREPDDAVEALVIGHGQRRQAELDRPVDQFVGRRGPVQEREVRVAMELGVGSRRGGSTGHLGIPGLDRGPSMIEQMFD